MEEKKAIALNLNNWNEVMNSTTSDAVFEINKSDLSNFLPKKVAALEMLKEAKTGNILSLAVIVASLVTAVSGSLHPYAGAGAAGIFSIYGAFFIKKAREKINYLKSKYNVDTD